MGPSPPAVFVVVVGGARSEAPNAADTERTVKIQVADIYNHSVRAELLASDAAAAAFFFVLAVGSTYHSTARVIAASISRLMTASAMRPYAIFHLPASCFVLACVGAAAAARFFNSTGGCAAAAARSFNSTGDGTADAAAALH